MKYFICINIFIIVFVLLIIINYQYKNNYQKINVINENIQLLTNIFPFSLTHIESSSEDNNELEWIINQRKINKTKRTFEGLTMLDSTILTNEEKQRFVNIAYEVANKIMEITNKDDHTIYITENFVFIVFELPINRPLKPGPDFIIQIKIDRKTNKIIEMVTSS